MVFSHAIMAQTERLVGNQCGARRERADRGPVAMPNVMLLRRAAENELFDLIEADADLALIMKRFGADREVLRRIYGALLRVGAGQWARGHWVPASAIAFGTTSPYALTLTSNGQMDSREVWQEVAVRLIAYFERGEVLPMQH